jgi:hypothetical protein
MNDWVKLLPIAEFADNKSRTTATGYWPFYANYRFYPNSIVTQPRPDILLVSSKANWLRMMVIHKDCHETLETSLEVMKKYVDRHCTEAPKYSKATKLFLAERIFAPDVLAQNWTTNYMASSKLRTSS